jgi:hypothetical protein
MNIPGTSEKDVGPSPQRVSQLVLSSPALQVTSQNSNLVTYGWV